jgi:hypothetical protein
MLRSCAIQATIALMSSLSFGGAWAGGGPLGIDHRVNEDDSGIWKRSNQTALISVMIGGELVGALWEGGETRLGKTFWQSIDASVIGGASTEVMKHVFRRDRPADTNDPNRWFGSNSDRSFPSGEVAAVSAIITPFVLEYGHDYPSVYILELLPVYDAIARVKVRGHWQTDVLAGFAVGSLAGYYAHSRESPLILGALPHGFMIGWRRQW